MSLDSVGRGLLHSDMQAYGVDGVCPASGVLVLNGLTSNRIEQMAPKRRSCSRMPCGGWRAPARLVRSPML